MMRALRYIKMHCKSIVNNTYPIDFHTRVNRFFMPIYIAIPHKGVAITISVKGGNYLQCRNAR